MGEITHFIQLLYLSSACYYNTSQKSDIQPVLSVNITFACG